MLWGKIFRMLLHIALHNLLFHLFISLFVNFVQLGRGEEVIRASPLPERKTLLILFLNVIKIFLDVVLVLEGITKHVEVRRLAP